MSLDHKLYRDGSFYDLKADPFETTPLPMDVLATDQAAAAQLLSGVLEQFADARPEHLRVKFPPVKIPSQMKSFKKKTSILGAE